MVLDHMAKKLMENPEKLKRFERNYKRWKKRQEKKASADAS